MTAQQTTAAAKPARQPAHVPAERADTRTEVRDEPLAELQDYVGNRSVALMLGGAVQTKSRGEDGGGAAEQEADRAAETFTRTEPEVEAGANLIVEDEAPVAAPAQMRKSEFLSKLRASVCASADEGMAGTGQTSAGCPYIEYWIGQYENKSVAHLGRAIAKFEPEAALAESAPEVIRLLTSRVRRSVDQWARTGEISGLPEGMPADMPGVGSLLGGVFFKARPSGARTGAAPALHGRLGPGRPLDGGVRGRMERAFGVGFSRVRLHTDGAAAQASDSLNARAFTIGRDVAFGAGEYRPGTLVGDALIAHELAHVVQQGQAAESGVQRKQQESTGGLEADADRSAASAVVSLWSGAGLADIRRNAMPRLRTGLGLSRCSGNKQAAKPGSNPGARPADTAAKTGCPTGKELDDIKKAIVATYKFSEVTVESGACWTLPELMKVQKALAMIPADQRVVLEGVELRRVRASSCTGEARGCFTLRISGENRKEVLEMADQAFAADREIESPDVAKVERFDATGKRLETLPSQETVFHETGHAFEEELKSTAIVTKAATDKAATKAHEKLRAAIKEWNSTSKPASGISWNNGKEKTYSDAMTAAGRALLAVIVPVNNLPDPATAAEFRGAARKVKDAVANAKKKIAARDAARKALPASSSAARPDVESDQDANLTASGQLLAAVEARAEAQANLDRATSAEAAVSARIRLPKGEVIEISRRLSELVALINLKGIDIAKSSLGSHAIENWPKNPTEVYATLYERSISQPEGLKKFDKDIAAFFKSPVGPKGRWAAQVNAWIRSNSA